MFVWLWFACVLPFVSVFLLACVHARGGRDQDGGRDAVIRCVAFLNPMIYVCFDGGGRQLGPGEIYAYDTVEESISLVQVLSASVDDLYATNRVDRKHETR